MNIPERTTGAILGLHEMCQYLRPRIAEKEITIVEIGSWTGVSALVFAKYFQKVFAIDPWEKTSDEISSEYDMSKIEKIFDARAECVKAITKMKLHSLDAVAAFNDESIDIVYIDGSHKYEAVKEDIAAWLPKVKKSGFVCGHDFHKTKFPGVVKAVIEMIGEESLEKFSDTSWAKKKEFIKC